MPATSAPVASTSEREQHHERALVGRVVAMMAVLMLGMGGRLDVVTVVVVLDALVLAMRVLVVMAVRPSARCPRR